jgi:radical SAM superfamily enzyme YgiQ (UPF0313 family)
MTSGVWLISSPCESEFLGYSGEPTSILYAGAVLWDEVRAGRVITDSGRPLGDDEVRLFAWWVLTERVFEEVEEAVLRAPPRVVCLSATTPTTDHALRIARIVKKHSPETFVLFGGPHEDEIGRVDDAGAAKFDAFDTSVAGDGEFILHALVAAAVAQTPFRLVRFLQWLVDARNELAGVPGTWQLTVRSLGPGKPAEQWPYVANRFPDRIPPLPRALLVRDRPRLARSFQIFGEDRDPVSTAQIITERGCAWRCSFCVEWRIAASQVGYRRSIDDVIAEIEEARRLGYGALFFDDSTMFTGFGTSVPESRRARATQGERRAFIHALFEYLKTTGLEWGCQSRVDTIEPELLGSARAAGCTYIYFGAESASEEQLEDMHKEQSRASIIQALAMVRRAGIRIGLSMLFGMPSAEDPLWTRETELTVEESLSFFASEVRKGGVAVVSRNLTAFYPGSTRTHMYFRKRVIDLWVTRPQARSQTEDIDFPWNRFEDGAGHHARNVTAALAAAIVQKSEELLGPWLIKTYIHAHPIERAGDIQPVVDLAHNPAAARGEGGGGVGVGTTHPCFGSFDEALHDTLEPLVAEAVENAAGLVPQAVPAGFHILEAIRRIGYIGRGRVIQTPSGEVAPHWLPIWNALDEQGLLVELSRACTLPVHVVVVPAVLPETGVVVDLIRVRRSLARSGFEGCVVIDWSDALLVWPEREEASVDTPIISLVDPGRVLRDTSGCLAIRGVAGPECIGSVADPARLARLAAHCRAMRNGMIEELARLECRVEVVGTTPSVIAPQILAVRLAGVDQFAVVKRLWRDHNVLCTFVGPTDLIRFQFDQGTSRGDIRTAVNAMVELLPACLRPHPSASGQSPAIAKLTALDEDPVVPVGRLAPRPRLPRQPKP